MGNRLPVSVLSLALMIALAGCGLTGIDRPIGGDSRGGGAGAAGGPPPGGWPQPENGRLTDKMCGLLTDADYAKFGHRRLARVSEERPVPGATNAVSCIYMTADELVLNLQPTTQAAKLVFAAGLRSHRRRMTQGGRRSILATSVVRGADESWFDYWTLGSANSSRPEHELQLRRGSLLVGITLSGLRGKNEQEPRDVLVGLAGLVLQRIPDVGKTDTGVTHKVRYEVTGSGRARSIIFYDPARGRTVTLKNVRLPWRVNAPLATTQPQVPLNLNAVAANPTAFIGCRISVDGKQINEQAPRGAIAFCNASYSERGTG